MFPQNAAALVFFACMATLATAAEQATLHAAIDPAAGKAEVGCHAHEQMNAWPKATSTALMIGARLGEGSGKAVWKKYYAKRNAVNLGIGGDRTRRMSLWLQNGNIKGISPSGPS